MKSTTSSLYKPLQDLIERMDITSIPNERKSTLRPLIDFIQEKVTHDKPININFICTHNSRRSHLAQVWAQTMASYFGFPTVRCYSGGTMATKVFPVVIETLMSLGFQLHKIADTDNPIYSIKNGENEAPIITFSKKYDDEFNPSSEFAAVMTCSEADGDCPIIFGAEKRIPVTYQDPKAFDNSPEQEKSYHERSMQIATELFFVFSQIKF